MTVAIDPDRTHVLHHQRIGDEGTGRGGEAVKHVLDLKERVNGRDDVKRVDPREPCAQKLAVGV